MKPHIQKTEPIDLSQHRFREKTVTTIWQMLEANEEAYKSQLWQQIAPLFEHVDGYGLVIQQDMLRKAIFNDKEPA